MLSDSIKEIIDQSVQFGKFLNKPLRRRIFDYILYKFQIIKSFNESKITNDLTPYINFINKLIINSDVVSLAEKNDSIFTDILTRIIKVFEQLEKEINITGDFQNEELELINMKNSSLSNFFIQFEKNIEKIRFYNPTKDFNIQFFENEYEKLKISNSKNVNKQKLALKNEILERWELNLLKKKYLFLLKRIDEERKKFCDDLYEQIEKLKKMMKILQPFTNECGRLWDLSKGLWQTIDFSILEYYAQLVEKEPAIQELAEILGRMHQAEDELEEDLINETIIKPIKMIDHAQKSELVGIHESNDINYLLPLELTNLDDSITELIFYQKFSEKKLLSYQFLGHNWGYEEDNRKKVAKVAKKTKKGPIIICVDTSGSMHGLPEYIAKTLCFAILRIALIEQRSCYLISFSTSIRTLELTDFDKSLPKLIDFLTSSFHGGTDAVPALREAIRKIQHKKYEKSDVLMISDFIMEKLDSNTEKQILKLKEHDTKFHSLVITSYANPKLLEIFDNNWIYDSDTYKELKPLLKNFRVI
ncbi:MAG: VWA domain-containing protein [Candidatus Hermodarchaeota archaeon]